MNFPDTYEDFAELLQSKLYPTSGVLLSLNFRAEAFYKQFGENFEGISKVEFHKTFIESGVISITYLGHKKWHRFHHPTKTFIRMEQPPHWAKP